MVAANIPFNKLSNAIFRSFLENNIPVKVFHFKLPYEKDIILLLKFEKIKFGFQSNKHVNM